MSEYEAWESLSALYEDAVVHSVRLENERDAARDDGRHAGRLENEP